MHGVPIRQPPVVYKHRGEVGLPAPDRVPEATRLTVYPGRESHHIAGHGARLQVFVDSFQYGGGFGFLHHCAVGLGPHAVDVVLLERR